MTPSDLGESCPSRDCRLFPSCRITVDQRRLFERDASNDPLSSATEDTEAKRRESAAAAAAASAERGGRPAGVIGAKQLAVH